MPVYCWCKEQKIKCFNEDVHRYKMNVSNNVEKRSADHN